MKSTDKILSPTAFLKELKSIRLEIQPNELSDSTKTEMLQTLHEMELLVNSFKERLLKEEVPAASAKA